MTTHGGSNVVEMDKKLSAALHTRQTVSPERLGQQVDYLISLYAA